MRSAALRWILFVMVAAAGGFVAPSAQATTRDVCPAACTYSTIQSAVDAALDGDLIDIGPGTYVERVLVATPNLTFAGAGAGSTVVEGPLEAFFFNTAAQTATLTGVTLHTVGASTCLYNRAALTVRDSVIEGCTASAGGGIYTSGDLVLERVTVRNNTATPSSYGLGGGIYVDGNVALTGPVVRILDSEVTGNLALIGGGIYIEPGARVFVDSTLISTNNAGDTTGTYPYTGVGGGIRTYGELHLTNSTLSANTADLNGGGVAVRYGNVPVRIANTLFTGNATQVESFDNGAGSWGGGLYVESDGDVTVIGSAFEGNIAGQGGGIGVYNLLRTSSVTVSHGSITGNVAYGNGGGLWVFGGTVTVNAVTIESNMANGSGGGIDLNNTIDGALTIQNATVYGNLALVEGGGLAHSPIGAEMVNTILAGNSTFAAPSDCTGDISSLDFNLIGTADGCSVVGALNDLLGTDALPLDPLLGPGSYSDGITWSRPPLPGSPAIDSGEQCGRPRSERPPAAGRRRHGCRAVRSRRRRAQRELRRTQTDDRPRSGHGRHRRSPAASPRVETDRRGCLVRGQAVDAAVSLRGRDRGDGLRPYRHALGPGHHAPAGHNVLLESGRDQPVRPDVEEPRVQLHHLVSRDGEGRPFPRREELTRLSRPRPHDAPR